MYVKHKLQQYINTDKITEMQRSSFHKNGSKQFTKSTDKIVCLDWLFDQHGKFYRLQYHIIVFDPDYKLFFVISSFSWIMNIKNNCHYRIDRLL